jgi:ubiquitin-conjugating enzyme E2 R
MTFTEKYPYDPPTFRFLRPIYHPNVYPDGKVCISILHPPGEDEQSGEMACERWSSIQGVESVLRSILLLLDSPEIGSPANVDAGVMYRDRRADYDAKAKETVKTSRSDIPEGFVMPSTLQEAPPAKIVEDDDFWAESGDEFGGSDSSDQDFGMDDDDDGGEQEFLDDEEAADQADDSEEDEDADMSD